MSQPIDAVLKEGAARLSAGLRRRVADFALARRQPDGGFCGRAGGSDPYYTDFALRVLALVRPEEVRASASYARRAGPVADVPELFSRLSIAEICGQPPRFEPEASLSRWRLPSGCFTRGGGRPSAYWTFLGALCEEMAGLGHEPRAEAAGQILDLQQPDGGFVDCGEGASQTNPTCAAVGYLLRCPGAETEAAVRRAAAYLKAVEAPGGGFLACAGAPSPDLLSTFTALATLAATGDLEKHMLKRAVRFAGEMAAPDGGFRSCAADPETDVEYAYYGFGCLCLAAAHALA